ncbi:pentapeptide MXKDX repeat protein [Bordetella sp. BOR01]|uniref:pentapeptide MXKDX repeat protein n=1 Tax=Bordetella sp. BOR01 TaxID=2854779 RepID=UPI002108529F|nr:pentapeptide MXKDX repeat protein [Bordetella sp. BOR01]
MLKSPRNRWATTEAFSTRGLAATDRRGSTMKKSAIYAVSMCLALAAGAAYAADDMSRKDMKKAGVSHDDMSKGQMKKAGVSRDGISKGHMKKAGISRDGISKPDMKKA